MAVLNFLPVVLSLGGEVVVFLEKKMFFFCQVMLQKLRAWGQKCVCAVHRLSYKGAWALEGCVSKTEAELKREFVYLFVV